MAAADLAEYQAEWVEPISTTYRGWTVYEMPPNTQGVAALSMLNIMEALPWRAWARRARIRCTRKSRPTNSLRRTCDDTSEIPVQSKCR